MAEVLKALCDGSTKQATPGGQVVAAKVPRKSLLSRATPAFRYKLITGTGR